MVSEWERKAWRKLIERGIGACHTYVNDFPLEDAEKQEIEFKCLGNWLDMSKEERAEIEARAAAIADSEEAVKKQTGHLILNPESEYVLPTADIPPEALVKCEQGALIAAEDGLEPDFRSWCLQDIPERFEQEHEIHSIQAPRSEKSVGSEKIMFKHEKSEEFRARTLQQVVKKTDAEEKDQVQDTTENEPTQSGKIYKGIKVRIYPTKEQEILFNKTLGSCRFLYNKMLEERRKVYKQLKGDKDKLDLHKYKTEAQYKEEFAFLKEVDSTALQSATNNLIQAFKNFSEGRKKRRKVGYPKFKSKRQKQTYTTKNVNNSIRVNQTAKRIKLPKVGWMKYRDNRDMNYKIKRVTISKEQNDRFFAASLVEVKNNVQPLTSVQLHKIEAYDMSAVNFLVSEKIKLSNPRFYRSQERKLKRLHRRLSRKQNGSQNREKARIRLVRLYEKIQNRKKDWTHKLTHDLSIQRDAVILEDLNIEGMKQFNKGLSKSITLDFSWNQFTTYLKYKMARQGKYLIKVDRFFPSSKQCSVCGQIANDLQLSDRTWTCPCGATHDRDVNASINLKQEGIRILESQGVKIISTVGTTGSHASGDRVRPALAGSGQGTRKPSAFGQ